MQKGELGGCKERRGLSFRWQKGMWEKASLRRKEESKSKQQDCQKIRDESRVRASE